MSDVTLLVAFGAGMLALVSPCSALLLPSFFAYAFTGRGTLLARTAVFYLGLASVLVPLGVGSRLASELVYGHRAALITVAGWTVIALGLVQLLGGGFTLPGAHRLEQAASARVGERTGSVATFALGAMSGVAGFCAGPVLGAILTVAATSSTPVHGGILLAAYALGMAAPLFVLAALWSRFDLRRVVRGRGVRIGPIHTHTTSIVSGLLFVGVGVVFLRYDGMLTAPALGLGDTTGFEIEAQQWLVDTVGRIPGWVAPAAIAVVAAAVAWRRARTVETEATDGGNPADAEPIIEAAAPDR